MKLRDDLVKHTMISSGAYQKVKCYLLIKRINSFINFSSFSYCEEKVMSILKERGVVDQIKNIPKDRDNKNKKNLL